MRKNSVLRYAAQALNARLAGTGNLSEAVQLGPDVIDVNSSLETSPGRKSVHLLKEFLASVVGGPLPRKSRTDCRK